jgi:hypothetical protein
MHRRGGRRRRSVVVVAPHAHEVELRTAAEVGEFLERCAVPSEAGARLPWLRWEDALLEVLHAQHGSRWRVIKTRGLPWRTDDSLRNRFKRNRGDDDAPPCRRASSGQPRNPWSEEEHARLADLCRHEVPSIRELMAHFPGRNGSAIRNRIYRCNLA